MNGPRRDSRGSRTARRWRTACVGTLPSIRRPSGCSRASARTSIVARAPPQPLPRWPRCMRPTTPSFPSPPRCPPRSTPPPSASPSPSATPFPCSATEPAPSRHLPRWMSLWRRWWPPRGLRVWRGPWWAPPRRCGHRCTRSPPASAVSRHLSTSWMAFRACVVSAARWTRRAGPPPPSPSQSPQSTASSRSGFRLRGITPQAPWLGHLRTTGGRCRKMRWHG
mmetsp:Transcript_55435/g.130827  ORF Transcript_55435/g.130827 Transcript_55435/m.130827 type:complete len:223 (-) Transcript_55435:132-800(-)